MRTVLIVEDNARNLKLVRDVLGHAGYETLEAPDAEAGLALGAVEYLIKPVSREAMLDALEGVL